MSFQREGDDGKQLLRVSESNKGNKRLQMATAWNQRQSGGSRDCAPFEVVIPFTCGVMLKDGCAVLIHAHVVALGNRKMSWNVNLGKQVQMVRQIFPMETVALIVGCRSLIKTKEMWNLHGH